eukprot:CAMPEP_0196807494 /NCGR_PEP_ID=MMETSP1362-20130617/7477_1 /TAXON_ID=163516 /ORGANISM="Leptocylindrus danicus, Strain CCMP1856" /LENGTH=75 /DNA_ID=CAMNT_0042181443 /DNA_START=35 /DNA_END=260 /DNA_ORIENTATION=+
MKLSLVILTTFCGISQQHNLRGTLVKSRGLSTNGFRKLSSESGDGPSVDSGNSIDSDDSVDSGDSRKLSSDSEDG